MQNPEIFEPRIVAVFCKENAYARVAAKGNDLCVKDQIAPCAGFPNSLTQEWHKAYTRNNFWMASAETPAELAKCKEALDAPQ